MTCSPPPETSATKWNGCLRAVDGHVCPATCTHKIGQKNATCDVVDNKPSWVYSGTCVEPTVSVCGKLQGFSSSAAGKGSPLFSAVQMIPISQLHTSAVRHLKLTVTLVSLLCLRLRGSNTLSISTAIRLHLHCDLVGVIAAGVVMPAVAWTRCHVRCSPDAATVLLHHDRRLAAPLVSTAQPQGLASSSSLLTSVSTKVLLRSSCPVERKPKIWYTAVLKHVARR